MKMIQKVLRDMTIKQGAKFSDHSSIKEIPSFIQFYNIDVNEILLHTLPITNNHANNDDHETKKLSTELIALNFANFNEFFYRKLKPGARVLEQPNDSKVFSSPADCRMSAFSSIDEATKLWIKGKEFTISNLLGIQKYDD